jgi:hypothetical protein
MEFMSSSPACYAEGTQWWFGHPFPGFRSPPILGGRCTLGFAPVVPVSRGLEIWNTNQPTT